MKWPLMLLLALQVSCVEKNRNAGAEINTLMNQQEAAWNEGDIEGFMKPYYKSDTLLFIGSRGLTYGWLNVIANYKSSYPDKDSMGMLKFENKLMRPLGKDHFWVAGQWNLYRKSDTLSGHYTLVWAFINGKWVIISDHSS